ncbi:radical SAM protein [Treponema zuelzerae]|uniref:Radical SAM protein n=1 Tax=Teretinema zuelzerae TaxID=156 RepID=A0AAE3EIU2_9SPIR|nr:radical SAM protein [Teretinema zuelzerae]MCD1654278.1 radical SAM protein [Teretinema zuelzerae]
MIRSVVIIQPPFVQLNGPYPAGAYLSAFFRGVAGEFGIENVRWFDAGNLFFRDLFSARGLERLFEKSREGALAAAEKAWRSGGAGAETARQLKRYLSLEKAWISWIDPIISILCGGDRELCHALVRSPHAPRGARMDAFFASLEGEPTADDGRTLATLAIEDLADYITAAVDGEFSLVRYAESIAASERDFSRIETALSRPLVADYYEPFLERFLDDLEPSVSADGQTLFCVSIPFPGCLVNALATARALRNRFGERALISMGGGYVNTELRNCSAERLGLYADFLCFDRGFGAYLSLLRDPEARRSGTLRFLHCPPGLRDEENRLTASISPDYSDIDFALYPRLSDTPNPMHRLWSDGAWLKAYLAHGCYWHRCSFCDVSLDYVGVYLPVGIPNLYQSLRAQALSRRVRGIHLVDEAAPPRALRDFALGNLRAAREDPSGGLLSFWGNIRFEKTFTRDLADFLSFGGLSAVSGGIEIASPSGFKAVDKGIDLENLVAVCAAFKEAGVLVHSYLIYGYWNETEQDVVDSAEVMRQLFAAGLVDSAFWHKFVLTRHSRVHREWEAGMHRGENGSAKLEPIDKRGNFADNDLRFAGEEASKLYTAPLDAALQAWMHGEGLDSPVRKWFPFSMPSPRIQADLIDEYIASYEKARDFERNKPFDPASDYCWTGSSPVRGSDDGELVWYFLGEEHSLRVDPESARRIQRAFADIPVSPEVLAALPRKTFKTFRKSGLVKICPLG